MGIFCKEMTCSQLVHGLKQSIRGCSALPPYVRDDWSWLTRWVLHDKCASMYIK